MSEPASLLNLDPASAPSALDPRGPASASIASLWWFMAVVGGIIYLATMGYLLWALFHRRQQSQPDTQPAQEYRFVLTTGAILPSVVILAVFGFTLATLRGIRAATTGDEPLVVSVVGHQWWWDVSYHQSGVRTANEIHIPVGQPVEFRLTSADVIHSFWVPQLHSKMDLNPGYVNTFRLVAAEAGEYWGECAEFCGGQHAKMRLLVIAQAPAEFEAWLAQQGEPAPAPASAEAEAGLEVFLSSGCLTCHAIEGTNATGQLGPNLTHLASRRTLAAGTLTNTRGNLGGWIADPHSVKRGVFMPASGLSGQALNDLLIYLSTLE